MKNLWRQLFPPRGEISALNQNPFNWKITVTFSDQLILIGENGEIKFNYKLGLSVKKALAIKENDSCRTLLGAIYRHNLLPGEDLNELRFVVHNYLIFIDRNELEKFASR